MKSSFKAKVKCAQLGLKYIGTGRGFETAIESIGLLARWKAWPQRRPTKRWAAFERNLILFTNAADGDAIERLLVLA
jgi:hypothetical protein